MVVSESHTLVILREIRESAITIAVTQADHTRRFDRIDARLDAMHESMVTGLGLAAHANVRHDTVEKRLTDLTKRVERLEKTR